MAEMIEKPKIFAVISWGCCATRWLARVLNLHPEIFCLHNFASIMSNFIDPLKNIDRLSYFESIEFYARDNYKLAGDVHGISRDLVPKLKVIYSGRIKFAVLTREPISRLKSHISLYETYSYQGWGNVEYIDEIITSRNLHYINRQDIKQRLFVHAVNMLNTITEEKEISPIFKMEDITSSTNALENLIQYLSGGSIFLSKELIEQMIHFDRVNHRSREKPHREFHDWQIDVIKKVVKPEMWDSYEELGYKKPDFI